MIIVVSALSYPRYCLRQTSYFTGVPLKQLLQMKHNMFQASQLAGGKPVGYFQAQPKDL